MAPTICTEKEGRIRFRRRSSNALLLTCVERRVHRKSHQLCSTKNIKSFQQRSQNDSNLSHTKNIGSELIAISARDKASPEPHLYVSSESKIKADDADCSNKKYQHDESSESAVKTNCDYSPEKLNFGINRKHHPTGLLEIAMKTIELIRRNKELQRNVLQLQLETKAFIESMVAHPDNIAILDTKKQSHRVTET